MADAAATVTIIRQRLDAVATWCPTKPAWVAMGPTRNDAELDAFEAEHGVTLPAGYRHFLREIGDGGGGLEWHGDCSCGRLCALAEWNLERSARPFPIDGDTWFEPETQDPDVAESFALPEGAEPTDGTVRIGDSTDHAGLHLVLTGEHAGEVWKDSTGYDGPFEKIAGDFLELSAALLHELVEAHRWRTPEENRALADELRPLPRVKFYCKGKNVNGLLVGDNLEEELEALCADVEEGKRQTAVGLVPLVLSSIVSLRVHSQDERDGRAPLDADEIHELARLWKLYRGKLVGQKGYEHFGPYGWLGRFVLYPATMLGFAELWDEMLAEAELALGHEGIHCRANHLTHAHIAFAAMDREPGDAFAFDDTELNEWEGWHLSKLVQRLTPEARERLRSRLPAPIASEIF